MLHLSPSPSQLSSSINFSLSLCLLSGLKINSPSLSLTQILSLIFGSMEECYKSFARWLSKLLNGGTEQQWRSATEASVPPGFIFTPTDEILIVYYLLPYVLTGCIHWNHVVEERVYEKEPGELLKDGHDVRYFFAKRTKYGLASDRIRRTVSRGTWTGKAGKSDIVSADGKTIGFKSMLSYCVNRKSEGYTMYEYELPQSVTNNFMQEEGAPTLHERVLCCVKKSPQKIAGSERSRSEAAAETKAAIVSSKRARHDGAFEVSGEYPGCNTSAAVVAAASYNTEPSTEYKTASSMHPPTAAEASLEGRVHTEASDFPRDQIMSSSAVDPPACGGWTKEMINVDTCKQYELKMTAAEVATTALPPSSGQDGAIYTGHLGWLSNVRCSPPPLPIDMEMSPPMNLPPNSALDLPRESVPADVATLAAAYYSATPPIVAEASLEGIVNTETIKLASTDQIMSPSAVDQQPPANNNSYRMEEMINTDISDTRVGYELKMSTTKVVATEEQPFDWEMLSPLDPLPSTFHPPLYCDMLPLSDFPKLPPESAPVDVATSTAADCSAMPLMYAADYSTTPPMYLSAAAEASLEGGVHTETIELASTDQIMSSSAIDQQPPAYNDSYRTEEMINADISDTCEMTTAEQHLPPPSCQDGDQPTASAQNLRYSPLLPQFDGQMPPPPDLLPWFDWNMPPPPCILPWFDCETPLPPDLLE